MERKSTFVLKTRATWNCGEKCVPSSDYYLKQAQLAARLALAESNPDKARALNVLALQHYEKAEKAKVESASR
jgi:hypothetical protein